MLDNELCLSQFSSSFYGKSYLLTLIFNKNGNALDAMGLRTLHSSASPEIEQS